MNDYEKTTFVTLDNYIGQKNLIETFKISITAAKMRSEPMGHILLKGPRGSGKRTLAYAVAEEIGNDVKTVSAKTIQSLSDLAAVLTNLNTGEVLILENLEAINHSCIDFLSDAMDSFAMETIVGKGLSSRTVRLDLSKFTLIAITDTATQLPETLRKRFYINATLTDYSENDLVLLAKKWSFTNEINITDEAAERIALFSRGSKRKLTNTLKRARDYAMVINNGEINAEIVDKTITSLTDNDFS